MCLHKQPGSLETETISIIQTFIWPLVEKSFLTIDFYRRFPLGPFASLDAFIYSSGYLPSQEMLCLFLTIR